MKNFVVSIAFLSIFNTSFANNFRFEEKSWTTNDSQSLCNFMRSQKFMNDATKVLNDDSLTIKNPVKKFYWKATKRHWIMPN
jgi:hypothetical protein